MRHSAVATAASITLTGLALAGCGGGTASGGGGDANTITFMAAAYSDGTEAYWQDLIQRFEAENEGMQVELSVVAWPDYDQRVTTLLANDQQPDLMNYNTWSAYAAADLLYPIEEITSPQVREDFLAAFVEDDSLDGTAYALPFIASARAMYYNTAIFAEAGITEPPATWQEFQAAAAAVRDAGYIGYALPLGTEEAQSEFALWAYNGGGDWQIDGQWAINSPANVETAQFLNDLVNTGKVTQDNPGATNRTDGAWQPFADGRVGMVFGFPGTFGQILSEAGLTDYDVAPPPTKEAGAEPTTVGVQDVLVGFKDETDKTETLTAFLDFFYQQENYTEFLTQEKFLPTTTSASQALASDPELGPYIDLLPNARFAPTSDPAWTSVSGDVKQSIGQVVDPGADAQAILDDLQAKAETAQ